VKRIGTWFLNVAALLVTLACLIYLLAALVLPDMPEVP
jgi:hypothetical protein